jgi:regulator of protease activity HflC (stomatin/prohibitin superfamily)
MTTLLVVLIVVGLIALITASASLKMVQQYQRGVVLRFGRLLPGVREPGLRVLVPFADQMTRVPIQTLVLDVPSQGTITRDNVTIGVDAVVYFRVVDPVRAAINVQDYMRATSQVSQTSLRSVIGRADLDTLLSDREAINAELRAVIDTPTEDWGIRIDRVEVKDISLPEGMRRSMSRQAEAERDRRAKVIDAEAEFQAATRLAEAADLLSANPAAMQLRYLQTLSDVGKGDGSTVLLPLPLDVIGSAVRAVAHDARGNGTGVGASTTP